MSDIGYFYDEVQSVIAVPLFVLLFPLVYLVGVDIDNQVDKGEGDDGHHHRLPLMPAVEEDSDDEQPIANEERFHGFGEGFGISHSSIFDLAANVEMGHNKEQKGGC